MYNSVVKTIADAIKHQKPHIDLSGERLNDDDIEAIVSLLETQPHITSLNLSENNIGEKGGKALSKLTSLVSLDLSKNRTDLLPINVKDISKLTNLASLDLSHSVTRGQGVQNIEAIAQLKNLVSLGLAGTGVNDAGARAIGKLQKLISLDLSNNNAIYRQGIEDLSTLQNLRVLNLSGNCTGFYGRRLNGIDESSLSALSKLPKLLSLDLSKSLVTDDLSPLAKSPLLMVVDLKENFADDADGKKIIAQAHSHLKKHSEPKKFIASLVQKEIDDAIRSQTASFAQEHRRRQQESASARRTK